MPIAQFKFYFKPRLPSKSLNLSKAISVSLEQYKGQIKKINIKKK